jgi:hypothetical protein
MFIDDRWWLTLRTINWSTDHLRLVNFIVNSCYVTCNNRSMLFNSIVATIIVHASAQIAFDDILFDIQNSNRYNPYVYGPPPIFHVCASWIVSTSILSSDRSRSTDIHNTDTYEAQPTMLIHAIHSIRNISASFSAYPTHGHPVNRLLLFLSLNIIVDNWWIFSYRCILFLIVVPVGLYRFQVRHHRCWSCCQSIVACFSSISSHHWHRTHGKQDFSFMMLHSIGRLVYNLHTNKIKFDNSYRIFLRRISAKIVSIWIYLLPMFVRYSHSSMYVTSTNNECSSEPIDTCLNCLSSYSYMAAISSVVVHRSTMVSFLHNEMLLL